MDLRFHSGGCCGFKVICSLPRSPEDSAWQAEPDSENNQYAPEPERDGDESWYSAEILLSTGGNYGSSGVSGAQAFDQILDYLRDYRPGSIAQVVIAVGETSYYTQREWIPFLTDRGFKEVDRFVNGNSGAELAVFHGHIRPGEAKKDDDYYLEDEGD